MFDKLIIIVYFILIVTISIINRSKDSYISSAENNMFTMTAVLTSGFIGGGYTIGNAEGAKDYGLIYSIALCGFSVGMIVFSLAVIPKIKRNLYLTPNKNIFESYGKAPSLFTSAVSVIFLIGMSSVQLVALGKIISGIFGIGTAMSVAVSASVVLIYTTVGGIDGIYSADKLQLAVIIFGTLVFLIFGLSEKSGHVVISEGNMTLAEFIGLFITYFIGEMITPQLFQRMKMSKDLSKVKKSIIISSVIASLLFISFGILGQISKNSANVSDSSLVNMIYGMPSVLKGTASLALLGAIVSSADSAMNTSTAVISESFLNEKWSKNVIAMRFINIAVCLTASLIAICVNNCLSLIMISYKFFAPLLFSQLLDCIIGGKGTAKTFFITALFGMSAIILWDFVLKTPFGFSAVPIGVAANIISFLIMKKRLKISRFKS